jgi:hypothetical protein
MRIAHLLAAAGALTLVSAASFAQVGSTPQVYSEMVPPDKGTAEVSVSLSTTLHALDGADKTTAFGVSYLPYLNRNIQVGGGLTYADMGSGYKTTGVQAIANYNFVSATETTVSRTVPYAGLAVGTTHVKQPGDSKDVTSWGAQAGVKQFITHDISLFAELNYRKLNKGMGNETQLFVGLNTYLKG